MVDFAKLNRERKERKGKIMKELKKPGQPSEQDKTEADKAFAAAGPPVSNKFSAFGPINTESEGVEVGLMNTEKFLFDKIGDRLVGYLKSRKVISMGDDFTIYEVYNADGDWSFSGSKLVAGRMEEIPDHCIVDITYVGDKMSGKRNQPYKDYRVKWYPWPQGVDPYKVRVTLDPEGKNIIPVDFPSDLGATPKAADDEDNGKG